MRRGKLLPLLLFVSSLIQFSSSSVSITRLTTSVYPGKPPRVYIKWADNKNDVSSTYELTIRRVGTRIPNVEPWSVQNITEELTFTFEDLEFAANYTVTVKAIKDESFVGDKIQTLGFIKPTISNHKVHVLMMANPRAANTALIGYKLTSSKQDKAQFPHPRETDKVILFRYYSGNELTVNTKVTIGMNDTSGPNDTYTNIELEGLEMYSFTQRFDVNGTQYYYPWSDPFVAPHEHAKDDNDMSSVEIVGIIVGITSMIIGLAFIVICCFNWKYSLRYRPKPQKAKPLQRLVTDPAIPVTEDDFYDHVCQMKLHNFKGFYEEFSSVKKKDFRLAEAFGEPDNLHKNRFVNIPCYDDTRVHLEGSTNVDTYIHANYIPGAYNDQEYIYAQSPLPETVGDFWTMVWEQGCDIIVMIGQFIEKSKQECANYFPDGEDAKLSSEIHCDITLTDVLKTVDYTIRTMLLSKDGEVRKLTHYQYHGWPTNKMTPEYPTSFLRMLLRISKSIHERPGKRIVVHGTNDRHGRAGVFACIDSQIQRFLIKADLSVFGGVVTCTKNRHDGVKTLDEYIFIHDAISEAVMLKSVDTITVAALPKYIEDAAKGQEGKDLFVAEFDFLTSASMASTQKMAVASQLCNAPKNRYSNVKPYDYNRVKLKKLKNQEGSDYINASYIDTYKRKRPFIVTQAPLVETIADFWRMIYENKSWVIVMLGQEIEGGQLKANRFWPEEGHVMKLDDITVKYISIQQDAISDVWIRQMELMDEKGERKLIQFYQYQEWPSQKAINSQNIRSLIQLVDQSESWKKKLTAQYITVVSSSGIGRAGVLVALTSLQEESDNEGSVDVFRTVQQLNQQRASLVQTREEYSLIYTATLCLTENARRRVVIKEQASIDDMDDDDGDGNTLGIDLTDHTLISGSDEPVKKDDEKKTPSVRFGDLKKTPSVSFDDVKKTPSVKFQMDDKEEKGEGKKNLGRINTQSYESKM